MRFTEKVTIDRRPGLFIMAVCAKTGKVAVGCKNDIILYTNKCLSTTTLSGHAGSVLSVKFSPCDGNLASSSSDGMVLLWGANHSGYLSFVHSSPVYALAFHSTQPMLATACSRELGVWQKGATVVKRWAVVNPPEDLVWCPTGSVLTVAFATQIILFLCTGAELMRLALDAVSCMLWTIQQNTTSIEIQDILKPNFTFADGEKISFHSQSRKNTKSYLGDFAESSASEYRIQTKKYQETDISSLSTKAKLIVATKLGHIKFYSDTNNELNELVSYPVPFIPLDITEIPNENSVLVAGSGGYIYLFTSNGVFIKSFETRSSLIIKSLGFKSGAETCDLYFLALDSSKGVIALRRAEMIISTVHTLYESNYVMRKQFTKLQIQDCRTERQILLDTNRYIRKISAYSGLLAVQISDEVYLFQTYPILCKESIKNREILPLPITCETKDTQKTNVE